MNREILFRGKRTDNGEWVEGYYTELPVGSLGATIFSNDDEIVCENTASYIIKVFTKQHSNYSSSNPLEVIGCEQYEIIPDTVGQYTGLTDKNGKKIFEGDILKQKTTKKFAKYNNFEWECYGIVKFGEYDWRPGMQGYRSMGWYVKPLRNISINPPDYRIGNINAGLNQDDILNRYYPYEVIGNIHDNPELLED